MLTQLMIYMCYAWLARSSTSVLGKRALFLNKYTKPFKRKLFGSGTFHSRCRNATDPITKCERSKHVEDTNKKSAERVHSDALPQPLPKGCTKKFTWSSL